tara:strand:- start:289 stop:564 length:276 start_codon:yes stop_codon:yes gene_type:complete
MVRAIISQQGKQQQQHMESILLEVIRTHLTTIMTCQSLLAEEDKTFLADLNEVGKFLIAIDAISKFPNIKDDFIRLLDAYEEGQKKYGGAK